MDHYDKLLTEVELHIVRTAKEHDGNAFVRLRSVPGIGKILALVILYEIHNIDRFPTVQDFVSYVFEWLALLVPTASASRWMEAGEPEL